MPTFYTVAPGSSTDLTMAKFNEPNQHHQRLKGYTVLI